MSMTEWSKLVLLPLLLQQELQEQQEQQEQQELQELQEQQELQLRVQWELLAQQVL